MIYGDIRVITTNECIK